MPKENSTDARTLVEQEEGKFAVLDQISGEFGVFVCSIDIDEDGKLDMLV